MPRKPAIWFPAVQAGTGADMFTIRLADALDRRGIRAEITWLPHRDDYRKAAAIYRRCRSEGHTIRSTIDCLIAQLCIRHGLTLLTKGRDFRAIAVSHPLRLVASS